MRDRKGACASRQARPQIRIAQRLHNRSRERGSVTAWHGNRGVWRQLRDIPDGRAHNRQPRRSGFEDGRAPASCREACTYTCAAS